MASYVRTGSITEIDHIEDIYTHIIEDFVGSCKLSKCNVKLRCLPQNNEMSLFLSQSGDVKTVDFRIGTNWIRSEGQYRAHLIDIFTHVAGENEEPEFLEYWIDAARNGPDFITKN